MPCMSKLAIMMSEPTAVFTFGMMDQRLILADQFLLTEASTFESCRAFSSRGRFSELAFRLEPIGGFVS